MKIVKTLNMSDMFDLDSSELTEFINAVREGVLKTQKQGSFELLTPIEFEISIGVKKKGKGGLNIAIVNAGGKYENESISKIKFSIGNPTSWEEFGKMVNVLQTYSKTSGNTTETALKIIESLKKG